MNPRTLAIKSVNSLSHYTDWAIAHVHTGALGWNGFLTFSVLYWLFPRLYNTKLFSTKLANWHFWIALLGMMFYVVPMYWSGITQGLMWKQFTKEGFMQYPNFLETVLQLIPMYRLGAIGGSFYIIGAFLTAYNLWRTARAGQFAPDVEARCNGPPFILIAKQVARWAALH
jgi:cytochrome c oxidase cbb3-type subunit I/II